MYDMVIEFHKLMALCSLQAFVYRQLSKVSANERYYLWPPGMVPIELYSVSQLWKATFLVRLHNSVLAFHKFHCTSIFFF